MERSPLASGGTTANRVAPENRRANGSRPDLSTLADRALGVAGLASLSLFLAILAQSHRPFVGMPLLLVFMIVLTAVLMFAFFLHLLLYQAVRIDDEFGGLYP